MDALRKIILRKISNNFEKKTRCIYCFFGIYLYFIIIGWTITIYKCSHSGNTNTFQRFYYPKLTFAKHILLVLIIYATYARYKMLRFGDITVIEKYGMLLQFGVYIASIGAYFLIHSIDFSMQLLRIQDLWDQIGKFGFEKAITRRAFKAFNIILGLLNFGAFLTVTFAVLGFTFHLYYASDSTDLICAFATFLVHVMMISFCAVYVHLIVVSQLMFYEVSDGIKSLLRGYLDDGISIIGKYLLC